MILLCGIPSETPLAMIINQLTKLNLPYIIFNQRRFFDMDISFEISKGNIYGQLKMKDRIYNLEDIEGVYIRLMDDRLLPELKNESESSKIQDKCRRIHDILYHWLEITPSRVVNRISSMGSNYSKPYQAQIIRKQGFLIPETLITNDPDVVREFLNQNGHIIYKSISSFRSIVRVFEEKDFNRIDYIRWCPTQFQQFIDGTDVRVHVVDEKVFATSIETNAIDYRYAHEQNIEIQMKTIELPDDLKERCVKLTKLMGLSFSGIDLKITSDNQIFCFEVNTNPAFNYFELNTGQPIARALVHYLAGKD